MKPLKERLETALHRSSIPGSEFAMRITDIDARAVLALYAAAKEHVVRRDQLETLAAAIAAFEEAGPARGGEGRFGG